MVEFGEGLLSQWLLEEMFSALQSGELPQLFENIKTFAADSVKEDPQKIDFLLRSKPLIQVEEKISGNQIPTGEELLECAKEFEVLLR